MQNSILDRLDKVDYVSNILYRYHHNCNLHTIISRWVCISVPGPWLHTYRVSHNWVFTLFWLFSQLPELLQRSILPFFNSPGDEDSKTHLTFLPTSKIDQVTEQNVRQIGFRYNLDKLCMYQKIISKSSLPHILLCNLIKVRRREESKVSFGIVISWAVEKW